jgi:hypothetical protein
MHSAWNLHDAAHFTCGFHMPLVGGVDFEWHPQAWLAAHPKETVSRSCLRNGHMVWLGMWCHHQRHRCSNQWWLFHLRCRVVWSLWSLYWLVLGGWILHPLLARQRYSSDQKLVNVTNSIDCPMSHLWHLWNPAIAHCRPRWYPKSTPDLLQVGPSAIRRDLFFCVFRTFIRRTKKDNKNIHYTAYTRWKNMHSQSLLCLYASIIWKKKY